MALTDPKNTLAYHSSRVLAAHRDMRDVPCATVAAAVAAYCEVNGADKVPEREALWFYGMNHGVALIAAAHAPLEPLPQWALGFVQAYHREMAPRAVRAFYYLLLICTREARHNKSLKTDAPKMAEKFGQPVASFFKSIKGGEPGIHKALLETPPAATIGTYCEALCWQFYNSSWNGGYGGPAWGAIADCLYRFVTGEYSAEMMLDTIWTLSHNNGPIFNKGMLYGMYDAHLIIKLLDVQRSGQIPQAVLHDDAISLYADVNLAGWMKQLKERFPDQIGDYVDWEVVEALGSVKKYPVEKKAQWEKHGMSPAAKAAKEAAEAKKKAALEAAAKAKAEHAKDWFTVMPGTEVKIIHRMAA